MDELCGVSRLVEEYPAFHVLVMIDPFNFVSFHDLTTRNFNILVAFDFIGQVVSTEPMGVIKDNARKKRIMSMVAQDLRINYSGRKMQVALLGGFALKLNCYISEYENENAFLSHKSSSINTTQLNIETFVAKPEDYYLRFPIKNIDDIPDYNEVYLILFIFFRYI
uniref:Uncharacterized protein n=1 Tax=Lactuca sativa TaxID=4236 RepID=A0A9R1W7Q4_LACSA|nr:hypothetical protein LSAT_V11C300153070 [Lactuca sativa]